MADDPPAKQNDYCVFQCKYETPFVCSDRIIGKESCLSNLSLTLWILMTDFMATFNVDNVFPQVPLIGEQKDFNNLPFRKVTSVLGFCEL